MFPFYVLCFNSLLLLFHTFQNIFVVNSDCCKLTCRQPPPCSQKGSHTHTPSLCTPYMKRPSSLTFRLTWPLPHPTYIPESLILPPPPARTSCGSRTCGDKHISKFCTFCCVHSKAFPPFFLGIFCTPIAFYFFVVVVFFKFVQMPLLSNSGQIVPNG